MRPTRRDALRWTVAGAIAGMTGRQAAAATNAIRLICGLGVGNPTDLCAQLIQDGFSAALKEPVEFDYTLGEAGRRAALDKLLPMQRSDFTELFTIMHGLPVTIRMLDPPLHEFLPKSDEEIEEVANAMGLEPGFMRRRIDALHEFNPMLGHRG
eukprot:gene57338-76554_t